jgi:hypothetical protein
MPNRFPFGRNEYEYRDGERYSTASGITLIPLDGEDNALFQQRTDHWSRSSPGCPMWSRHCAMSGEGT